MVYALLVIASVIICTAVFGKYRRATYWGSPPPPDVCRRCRYSRQGLAPEAACPECGHPKCDDPKVEIAQFDPAMIRR